MSARWLSSSTGAWGPPCVIRKTAARRYWVPTSKADRMAVDTASPDPRGHSSSETTTPTAPPTAMSSMRISPTRQPLGWIRLNTISTSMVNAAWPAVNDQTSGTNAARNATTGRTLHSTTGFTPISSISTLPMTNPSVVPITARSTLVPVVSALDRNTDIAASTTQNPCCTGNRCVVATARARPSPVRTLFRTTTARVARYPDVMRVIACVSDSTRTAAPVSGSSRPSTRFSTGRASAAAAPAMTRPVIATVAPKVRRSSSRWPTATAAASSGSPRSSAMSSR